MSIGSGVAFVLYPDARLFEKATPADTVSDDLAAVGARLAAANAEAKAYGLAAAHLGVVAPVVVINAAPDAVERQDLLLFNPRVTAVAESLESSPESSVSMPGVQIDVERPVWAEIAFQDAEGAAQTRRFEGFLARVALHEIDQMNGVFFISHLSRLKRDMLVRKFQKTVRLGTAGPAAG